MEQAAHVGCLVREEGSAWRICSTYLVQMTLQGRLLFHAKGMSLSGEQLNPLTCVAILRASGVDVTVRRDPAAAATDGDGGRFDVPNIPGASGYASIYRWRHGTDPRDQLAAHANGLRLCPPGARGYRRYYRQEGGTTSCR